MMKSPLKLVAPTTVNRTVTPRRRPNAEMRTREYLTETEVEKLIKAAGQEPLGAPRRDHDPGRLSSRPARQRAGRSALGSDRFRSGAVLHVRRVKQGTPSTHPIQGDELRALRRLQREQDPRSPFMFTSERGSPFSTAGFAKLVARAGEAAGLGFPAHPHMLRHACGFALADKGHDTRALQAYLGHRNIQHTVRYTSFRPIGSRISGEISHQLAIAQTMPDRETCGKTRLAGAPDRACAPPGIVRRSYPWARLSIYMASRHTSKTTSNSSPTAADTPRTY